MGQWQEGSERRREIKERVRQAERALFGGGNSYSLGASPLLSGVEPVLDLSSVDLFVTR
jgi:hypothetical protein